MIDVDDALLARALDIVRGSLRTVRDQALGGAPGLPDAWIDDAARNAATALILPLEEAAAQGARALAQDVEDLLLEARATPDALRGGPGLLVPWRILERLEAILETAMRSGS